MYRTNHANPEEYPYSEHQLSHLIEGAKEDYLHVSCPIHRGNMKVLTTLARPKGTRSPMEFREFTGRPDQPGWVVFRAVLTCDECRVKISVSTQQP